MLANAFSERYDRYRYKSIEDIGRQLGRDPADCGPTYENPVAVPTGIDYVLVNGEVVIDEGKHTGAKPGKALRGSGFSLAP